MVFLLSLVFQSMIASVCEVGEKTRALDVGSMVGRLRVDGALFCGGFAGND